MVTEEKRFNQHRGESGRRKRAGDGELKAILYGI